MQKVQADQLLGDRHQSTRRTCLHASGFVVANDEVGRSVAFVYDVRQVKAANFCPSKASIPRYERNEIAGVVNDLPTGLKSISQRFTTCPWRQGEKHPSFVSGVNILLVPRIAIVLLEESRIVEICKSTLLFEPLRQLAQEAPMPIGRADAEADLVPIKFSSLHESLSLFDNVANGHRALTLRFAEAGAM